MGDSAGPDRGKARALIGVWSQGLMDGTRKKNDMNRPMFLLSALLTFLAAPSAFAGVFVHCAEFGGDQGRSQRLAWFEVFAGGPMPSEESRAKGYYSVEELNGKTVSCRLGGNEYSFGVTEYRQIDSPDASLDVYRVRMMIDGVEMWKSEEIPRNPMAEAMSGKYQPFLGTVRIDRNMVSICRIGEITDIGDFAVPDAGPGPLTKPVMDASVYAGYRYGCMRYYLRLPGQ